MQVQLQFIALILDLITIIFAILTFLNFRKSYKLAFIFVCIAIGAKFISMLLDSISGVQISIFSIYLFAVLALDGLLFLILSIKEKSNKSK